ncbi:MAG: hypothetical protein EOP38_03840 [Rubrivivax sp.]|nr:MAG: hypothetical protein EOP38_03840 [Rubrivivax sp.]
MAEPSPSGSRPKALITHFLKIGLSFGIVAYLIHITDIDQIMRSAERVPAWALIATFVLNMAAVVYVQALANKVSLHASNSPTTAQLCKDNLGILFYTLFLPAGLTFVIRWKKYNERGLNGFISAAQVILHKVLQIWTSSLFMLTSVLALAAALAARYKPYLGISSVFFAVATGALAYFLLPRRTTAAASTVATGSSSAHHWFSLKGIVARVGALQRIYSKLASASQEVSTLEGRYKWALLALAIIQQALIVAGAYVVIRALHADISWMAVAFVRSVVVVLMLVPVSIAGIGLRELTFYGLLPMFGVSKEAAVTASLLLLANSIAMGLVGGCSELLDFLKKGRPA